MIPFDDRAVPALSTEARRAIAEHWRRRARSELEVGRAFAAMTPLLAEHGADRVVVEMLTRSARDEERHSALCTRLAATYAGAHEDDVLIGDVPLPRFGETDEVLELALLVSGMCCINETIASAWLAACLAASTAPLAIAINRAHLEDEIDHARLGWAHLASSAVSDATRDALASRLPALLSANLPGWERADAVLPSEGIAAHGHLGASESREVVRAAVRDVVIPGFAHVGIDTRAVTSWFAVHASSP